MKRFLSNVTIVVLFGVGTLGWTWTWISRSTDSADRDDPPLAEEIAGAPEESESAAALSELLDVATVSGYFWHDPPGEPARPVSAERVEPRPATPPPAPEPTRAEFIRFVGTIVVEGNRYYSFVDTRGNRPIVLAEGEAAEGWTLEEVREDGFVLSDASGRLFVGMEAQ